MTRWNEELSLNPRSVGFLYIVQKTQVELPEPDASLKG
jgi:hypothetical protein